MTILGGDDWETTYGSSKETSPVGEADEKIHFYNSVVVKFYDTDMQRECRTSSVWWTITKTSERKWHKVIFKESVKFSQEETQNQWLWNDHLNHLHFMVLVELITVTWIRPRIFREIQKHLN